MVVSSLAFKPLASKPSKAALLLGKFPQTRRSNSSYEGKNIKRLEKGRFEDSEDSEEYNSCFARASEREQTRTPPDHPNHPREPFSLVLLRLKEKCTKKNLRKSHPQSDLLIGLQNHLLRIPAPNLQKHRKNTSNIIYAKKKQYYFRMFLFDVKNKERNVSFAGAGI